MSIKAVLLPLFVEVALTFVLGFWLASLRVAAVRRGEVRLRDIALREPNWPPRLLQIQNAFHNQLELPVLFYVLTILVLMTRFADLLFVILAWVFVVLRLMQAYVHVTDNNVPRRGMHLHRRSDRALGDVGDFRRAIAVADALLNPDIWFPNAGTRKRTHVLKEWCDLSRRIPVIRWRRVHRQDRLSAPGRNLAAEEGIRCRSISATRTRRTASCACPNGTCPV